MKGQIERFLDEEEWYQDLSIVDRLKVLDSICYIEDEFYADKFRKLYNGLLYAYQWHCGSGSKKSEDDMLKHIQGILDEYNGWHDCQKGE